MSAIGFPESNKARRDPKLEPGCLGDYNKLGHSSGAYSPSARLLPSAGLLGPRRGGSFSLAANTSMRQGHRAGKAVALKRSSLIVAMLLVSAVGAAGWFFLRARSPVYGRPNIVLISLDTCRADYLSCYGRFTKTTPHIDALAREGILFANVISPVPMTLPAHSSMLTGTLPPYHGVHGNIAYRLGERNVTLAERLREHGYRTAAVIGAFVLDSRFGLRQGFDTYEDRWDSQLAITGGYPERRGEEVTRVAGDWLDKHASEPFFLFLHYFDPHLPYRPPAPFDSIYADDPYAGEIAYTDRCVGQVIDKLKSLGLYDSSLIVVVGDHGESLGEHGEIDHGYFIYHSTTKVPLIVKLPGSREAGRIDTTVSLIDIVPTLLGQVGLSIPPDVQGVDLSALLTGGSIGGEERYIYSESMNATKYGCSSLLGIETGRWKYIQTTEPELYDLAADPGETNNLARQQPRRVRGFKERLRSIIEDTLRPPEAESKLAMDPRSLERLRQLGYTGGAAVESFEFETDKEDPKGFLDLFIKLKSLDHAVDRHDHASARRICGEILAKRPDIAYVHGKLARMAVEQGRPDQAIRHFLDALALDSDSAVWHNNLGVLLVRQGHLDEAMSHFEAALRLGLGGNGDADDLDGRFARQGLIDSPLFNAYVNIGSVLLRQGGFAGAVDAFRQAVSSDPGNANGHCQLGVALYNLGLVVEAVEAYREALRLDPNHVRARRGLDGALAQEDP